MKRSKKQDAESAEAIAFGKAFADLLKYYEPGAQACAIATAAIATRVHQDKNATFSEIAEWIMTCIVSAAPTPDHVDRPVLNTAREYIRKRSH